MPSSFDNSRMGEILNATLARKGHPLTNAEALAGEIPLEIVAGAILALRGALILEYPDLVTNHPHNPLLDHFSQVFILACPKLFLTPEGKALYKRMEKMMMADILDIRNARS